MYAYSQLGPNIFQTSVHSKLSALWFSAHSSLPSLGLLTDAETHFTRFSRVWLTFLIISLTINYRSFLFVVYVQAAWWWPSSDIAIFLDLNPLRNMRLYSSRRWANVLLFFQDWLMTSVATSCILSFCVLARAWRTLRNLLIHVRVEILRKGSSTSR